MTYALIVDAAVAQYPYSFGQLRRDNPQVSFPRDPNDEKLAEFGVIAVAPADRPVYNLTKNVIEGTPELVNGVWTQTWQEVDAAAEESAARQLVADLEAEQANAALDPWIIAYLGMTPEEAVLYVRNNTANLAAMRSVVEKLAYSVRVLIRREFNR